MASLAETICGKKFTSELEFFHDEPGRGLRSLLVTSDARAWLDIRDGRMFFHGRGATENPFFVDCIKQMDTPHVCTIEDLGQEILEFLLKSDCDVNEGIRLFRERLEARCNRLHHSDPIAVATGPFARVLEGLPITLWEGHSDFRIDLVGSLPAPSISSQEETESGALQTLYVVTRGRCSHDAMQRHVAEVESVLTTLFRIVELCCTDEFAFIFHEKYAGALEIVDDGRLSGDFSLIPQCLDAFFSSPVKKDSMDKRVRSAIHLLVESERQENHAIGLALSVAAMEALVCFKESNIADAFAAHTARLLEPQSAYRAKAEKYFKRLYNDRSRAIHGEILEKQEAIRLEGLLVAAKLLMVIQERHDTIRRIEGHSEKPSALEALLKDEKYADGPLDGVLNAEVFDTWWLGDRWRAKDEGDPDITIHIDPSS